MKRLEDELIEYLKKDNALKYDPKEIGHRSGYTDELGKIASHLCGTAFYRVAYRFMEGEESAIDEFFDNVQFNGERSTPVIVKAIQIHLWNRKYDEDEEACGVAYKPDSTVINGVPVTDVQKDIIQDAINGKTDSVRYNYMRLSGYSDQKKVAYMAPSGNVSVVTVKELRTGLSEILSDNTEA